MLFRSPHFAMGKRGIKPMSDPLDDFEIEESTEDPAAADPGDDLWPEDRENLEKAMKDCLKIFSKIGRASCRERVCQYV